MKLLVIAQAVDTSDPVLGFFHRWLEELAPRTELLNVICLKEGEHSLPDTVRVHSLGKEKGVGRLIYMYRFYKYAYSLRNEYEAVFIHMNEEYALLGGLLWKVLGKRVYLWRNHYAGSWRTRLAALFCTKVFCTSKHSYTAKFRRTVLMPVGVDLERFLPEIPMPRAPRSILSLGRISPSKRPEMLIDALGEVLQRGVSFRALVVGSPKPEDIPYHESLQARAESLGLHDRVQFLPGVPNAATSTIYQAHDIFVNCSPSGMFDKTIFEATASGCRVLAASEDFRDAAGDQVYFKNSEELTQRLIQVLGDDEDSIERQRISMGALARAESLATLTDRLLYELSPTYSAG